jgi:arylformamidase
VPQFRAELDAEVTLDDGGVLRASRFRVDLPHSEVTEAEIGRLFVAACGLRSVRQVQISGVRVYAEPHASPTPAGAPRTRLVELSHVIGDGLVTYPGLPGPELSEHLSRADSRRVYADGVEFSIGRITMLGNTGTYVDSPFHRYGDGTDLAGLPLERLADLPAVVVRAVGGPRGVDVPALEGLTVAGHAVLVHTGGDQHWATPAYAVDAPYLTEAGAEWLVSHGATLVGIDAVNIDDIEPGSAGRRPAHSILLAAGIPICEHLTGLEQLPPIGARFTAAPPRIAAFSTFPVRAFAAVPAVEEHDHLRSGGWLPTAGG